MHRLILVCVMLAACAAPAPTPRTVFRNAGGPIYSSAAFDMAQLEGRWLQAAAFSAGDTPGCAPGGAEFSRTGAGLQVTGRLCLSGKQVAFNGPVAPTGPGRFTVPGMGEWWVVWVDVGYRTLAIGTPSGAWGFVLDEATISGDRLRAATEIFDFNGYPAPRLKAF